MLRVNFFIGFVFITLFVGGQIRFKDSFSGSVVSKNYTTSGYGFYVQQEDEHAVKGRYAYTLLNGNDNVSEIAFQALGYKNKTNSLGISFFWKTNNYYRRNGEDALLFEGKLKYSTDFGENWITFATIKSTSTTDFKRFKYIFKRKQIKPGQTVCIKFVAVNKKGIFTFDIDELYVMDILTVGDKKLMGF